MLKRLGTVRKCVRDGMMSIDARDYGVLFKERVRSRCLDLTGAKKWTKLIYTHGRTAIAHFELDMPQGKTGKFKTSRFHPQAARLPTKIENFCNNLLIVHNHGSTTEEKSK